MTNNTTQFLDLMKSFMNPEFYTNSLKNFPVTDFSTMSDTIKKSTKILATTNQIATESLHHMIQKNSEAFQNNTMNMFNTVKEAMSSGDLKKITECQQKYLKSAYESSIHNAKDFANMASEASLKMIETVNNMSEQVVKACDNIKNKA